MKKIQVKKAIIAGVFACSAMALAGVGFASWIITGGTTSQSVSLTVTAADVVDKRITLSAAVYSDGSDGSTYGTVNFGPTYSSAYVIQPSSAGTSEEDLSFGLAVSVSCATSGVINAGDTITASFTLSAKDSSSNSTTLASYIGDSNYLTFGTLNSTSNTYEFTYTLTSNDIPSSTDSNSLYTSTVKSDNLSYWEIKFGWGSYFGGTNPAAYYADGFSSLSHTLDNVVTALKEIKTAADNTTFACTVSYTAKSN